jgi:transposase
MTQISSVVGIDVSKGKLDWCIRGVTSASALNSPDGCAELAGELKRRCIEAALMEASGGYERAIAEALREVGILVLIVDPKRVRNFAKASGRRAKNDAIDADTIAWFGETFAHQVDREPDAVREEIAALMRERQGFVDMRIECLNRSEHERPKLCEKLRKRMVGHLERAIAELEATIAAKIAATEHLAEDARLLLSAPSVGPRFVAGVVGWLPELGRVSNEKIAALVGAAPFDDDSGAHKGVRHISGGRRDVRNLLYMATLSGIRHNPTLKAYYQHLRARGKLAKVAIVACMRKFITILNTMLARRQPWNPNAHARTVPA